LFLELPDRNAYADYYKLIANPIAMDMIAHRINSPYYTSLQAFAQDFTTMFKNAMTYNVEGSEVYEDASFMQEAFNQALQKHAQSLQQSAPVQHYPQQFVHPQQYLAPMQHSGQPQHFQGHQQQQTFPGQQQYSQQYAGQQYSAQQPTHPHQYPQYPHGFPQ
jgi:hypothetical protein